MIDVVARLGIHNHDVGIVQRVEDAPPLAPGAHEPERAQLAELMGYRRLRLAYRRGQIADAELPRGERGHDAQPGGITERGEEFGKSA